VKKEEDEILGMSRCFTWFPNWLFHENLTCTTIQGILL